ncbi:UPF0481 protein At3g47200-like [Humulus lupulus]|uniref:UPF0481 protein At3g47200-like n=1 Tax=Humulus lupulus TaxID=3486 RepID=UPI002B40F65D|nr:UPF0481 protein At3g47200-like [Humulus lupulus]
MDIVEESPAGERKNKLSRRALSGCFGERMEERSIHESSLDIVEESPAGERKNKLSRRALSGMEERSTHESRSDNDSIRLSSDDEKLIQSLTEDPTTTESGEAKNGLKKSHPTKIQKVQKMLKRGQFEEYYRPKEIAIGPIHASHLDNNNEIDPSHADGHDKDLDKMNLKHRLGRRFIQGSGSGSGRYDYAVNSLKVIKQGNFCNLFEERYGEDELARMLFVDGCAVLQFIDSYVNNDIKESDGISIAQADDIRHDLFLLENQIPFKVLVILMRLSHKGVKLAENVYRFISMNIMAPAIYYEGRLDQNISRLPKHPKDLFKEDNVAVPVHLLDLLRSELLFDGDEGLKEDGEDSNSPSYYKRSFRNVQDLKEVDIKFKADYSRGLRSVSFSNRLFFSPKLKLPPLIVDKSTKKKLLNLVAYEMCPDNSKQDYTVACYLRLLDSLIDCEQDVKDLRSAHILRNHLSSDEEVANLFNSVGSYLVPRDVYVAEKKKIQKHYERKMASWTAQFRQEHFRNPTTFFAFLVGLVILAATCIQAIYTVHPQKD